MLFFAGYICADRHFACYFEGYTGSIWTTLRRLFLQGSPVGILPYSHRFDMHLVNLLPSIYIAVNCCGFRAWKFECSSISVHVSSL